MDGTQGTDRPAERTSLGIPPLLLRINDAATVVGISRSEFYREMKRGRIKTVGSGRMRRVEYAECEAYTATRRGEEHAAVAS